MAIQVRDFCEDGGEVRGCGAVDAVYSLLEACVEGCGGPGEASELGAEAEEDD